MRSWLAVLLVLLGCAAGGAYAYREWTSPPAASSAGRGGRRGAGAEGPVAVVVTPSRRQDVPVTLEAIGTAQALRTVTVRPQVDGRLLEVAFREGQDVEAGDVIARIDPTIYQAQYDQAVARRAQTEANLASARLDLGRFETLLASNSGSKQQADRQRAAVAQLEAQLKVDEGQIDNARAFLDYTTVRAPIDGRLGIRNVDVGNILRAGEAGGLATIAQLRPMSVVFNLPQQNLRAVNAAAARGPVPVEALEADNRTILDRGTLEVVDNAVDPTTGTVRIKATFPNADLQLWPGSFVNVRLTADTLRDAVVVPTGAVQRGPDGPYVYGVADERAVMKPVTVARQDEALAVLSAGVVPPEPVVTTGFARLTDGDRVRVVEAPAAAPAPASAGGEAGERRGPPAASGATGEAPPFRGEARGGERRRRAADGTPGPGSRPDAAGSRPGSATP